MNNKWMYIGQFILMCCVAVEMYVFAEFHKPIAISAAIFIFLMSFLVAWYDLVLVERKMKLEEVRQG